MSAYGRDPSNGAPVSRARSALVYTATRPVRALTLVVCPAELDWRVPFVSALRAQALVWGGPGNLLVPAGPDALERPEFWAIHRALDPDAVLVHPGSWGDIKDLDRATFDAHETALRTQLQSQEFETFAIEDFLRRDAREPWRGGPEAGELKGLVDRGSMLHYRGEPEFGYTYWQPEIGYPWVSLLAFSRADLPDTVKVVYADGDLDLDLILASTLGQVSSAARDALASIRR
jgi:hypothetical protein